MDRLLDRTVAAILVFSVFLVMGVIEPLLAVYREWVRLWLG
jgi:hypothetical protein